MRNAMMSNGSNNNRNNTSGNSSSGGSNILASPVARQRGTRSLGDLPCYDSDDDDDDDSITLEPLTRIMSSKKQPLACLRSNQKSLRQLQTQHQSLRQLMSINNGGDGGDSRKSSLMPTLEECFNSSKTSVVPDLCETTFHDSSGGSSTFSLGSSTHTATAARGNNVRGSSKEFVVSNPYIEEGSEELSQHADDDIVVHEQQQHEQEQQPYEEEEAFRSLTTNSSEPSNTTTTTTTPNNNHKTVEVTPGVHLPLVCAQDTWEAILDGNITVASCQCCTTDTNLYCIETADLVVCPTCWVISPVDDSIEQHHHQHSSNNNNNIDQRIVGIGIKMEDVQTMMEQRTTM